MTSRRMLRSAPYGALCAAILLATGPGQAATPDSLSIRQCIALARAAAPEVRIAAIELQAARFDSAAASRRRHPVVSLFGRTTIAPRGFYDPAFTDLGSYEIKAGITLPLFDGGAAARDRQRASDGAARAAFESDRSAREAGLHAAALAVEILALREREGGERRSLGWLGDLQNLLQSRVRGGSGGPSDLMRVALEQDAVLASLEEIRTELGIAGRELGQVVGWPAGSAPPVRSPEPAEDRAPTDEDSLRLVSRVYRLPEVRIAGVTQVQARTEVAEAEHRKALKAELSADAGLAGTDLTTAVPPDVRADDPDATIVDRLRRDLGASVTATVTRPLIDPAAAPTLKARQADVQTAALRLASETDTRTRLSLDLLDRWREAWRRLAASRAMVERAETNLLRVKTLYVAGAAGLMDLLDARRVLDDARERLANAQSGNRLSQVEAEMEP